MTVASLIVATILETCFELTACGVNRIYIEAFSLFQHESDVAQSVLDTLMELLTNENVAKDVFRIRRKFLLSSEDIDASDYYLLWKLKSLKENIVIASDRISIEDESKLTCKTFKEVSFFKKELVEMAFYNVIYLEDISHLFRAKINSIRMNLSQFYGDQFSHIVAYSKDSHPEGAVDLFSLLDHFYDLEGYSIIFVI